MRRLKCQSIARPSHLQDARPFQAKHHAFAYRWRLGTNILLGVGLALDEDDGVHQDLRGPLTHAD